MIFLFQQVVFYLLKRIHKYIFDLVVPSSEELLPSLTIMTTNDINNEQ